MRLDHLLSKEKEVRAVVYCLVIKGRPLRAVRSFWKDCLVAMRPGETPVPIPNTMVKARAADGTALETMWESRWLPDFKKERPTGVGRRAYSSAG